MSALSEITKQVLSKFGYTKEPNIAHVPSIPYITSGQKSEDYIKAYSGWVYGTVKRRAEQIANVDIKLMREGKMGTEEVYDHPASKVLDEVNNQMTRSELMEITNQHLDLAGESFWHVDRGESATGEPQSILPMLPYKIKVVPGKDRLVKGYIYSVNDANGTPKEIPLEPEEVVFLKEPDPNNLFRGMSAVRAAAQTIDVDDDAEKWNWHAFKHGTSAKPVFETEQSLGDEQLEMLYTKLQEHWSGVEKANKPMIMHSGLKSSQVGFSPKDMEYLNGQKWTRDKILSLIGVTGTILGITEDVNRANAEVNEYVFNKYMVVPRVKKIVGYLNEFYLPMFKGTDFLYFAIDDPTPPNVEQETKKYTAALAGGSWMTPNEVRKAQNLEEVEGGDSLYVPNTLVAIDGKPEPKELKFESVAHKRAYLKRQKSNKYEQDMTDKINIAVSGLIERLMSKEKPSYRQLAEKKGGFHDQLKQYADSEEKTFKQVMRKYFNAQQKEVLGLVQQRFSLSKTWKKKSPVSDFLFKPSDWKSIGVALVMPLYKKIIDDRGNEALFFIGSSIGFNIESPRVTNYIKQQGGKLITDIDKTTLKDLRKTLSDGADKGEGIHKLQKRVMSVYDKANDARAESIARTEVIKASNYATEEGWKQSGVVEGKEWLTAEDERVCPWCNYMDEKSETLKLGKSWFKSGDKLTVDNQTTEFDSNIPHPPLHPRCRCTIVPVLKEIKSEVNRAKPKPTGITEKDIDKLNKKLAKIDELTEDK